MPELPYNSPLKEQISIWKYTGHLERMVVDGDIGGAIEKLYKTLPKSSKHYKSAALLRGRYRTVISDKEPNIKLTPGMLKELQEDFDEIMIKLREEYRLMTPLDSKKKQPTMKFSASGDSFRNSHSDWHKQKTVNERQTTGGSGIGYFIFLLFFAAMIYLGYGYFF